MSILAGCEPGLDQINLLNYHGFSWHAIAEIPIPSATHLPTDQLKTGGKKWNTERKMYDYRAPAINRPVLSVADHLFSMAKMAHSSGNSCSRISRGDTDIFIPPCFHKTVEKFYSNYFLKIKSIMFILLFFNV